MARRSFAGGAVRTTITGSIPSSGGGTVTIAAATGWPDGSGGKFHVVVNPGDSSEEKILMDSLSGTTLTYSAGGRGADGSTATSHASGASIWLCYTAVDADEANAHVNLSADAHAASAITFTPTGNIAATTVQAAIAEVDSETDARLDALESTDTATDARLDAIEANNWVTAARIAVDSVSTNKIIDENVTTAKIAGNAVTTAKILDGNVTYAKLAAPVEVRLRRAAVQAIGSGLTANISWDTEDTDTTGFITVTSDTLTVPAGQGGVYVGHIFITSALASSEYYANVTAGGKLFVEEHTESANSGRLSIPISTRLAAGDTIVTAVTNVTGGGISHNFTARLELFRVAL